MPMAPGPVGFAGRPAASRALAKASREYVLASTQ